MTQPVRLIFEGDPASAVGAATTVKASLATLGDQVKLHQSTVGTSTGSLKVHFAEQGRALQSLKGDYQGVGSAAIEGSRRQVQSAAQVTQAIRDQGRITRDEATRTTNHLEEQARRQSRAGGFLGGTARGSEESGLRRGFVSRVTGIGGFLAGPGFVAGAIGGLAIDRVVKATLTAQEADTQLRKSVEASGKSWAVYRAQIEATLAAQEKTSGFTKTDLTTQFTTMLRVTGSLTGATKAMADSEDIARGRHIALAQAVLIDERAHEGNVGALNRIGIQIPKVTTHMDELRAAHIKVTDANRQQVIALTHEATALDKQATGIKAVNAIEAKYHGDAVARTTTLQGRWDSLRNTLDDYAITIGMKAIPEATKLLAWMQKLVNEAQTSTRFHKDLTQAVNDLKAAWHDTAIGVKFLWQDVLAPFGGFLNRHHDLVKAILATWIAWKGAMVITHTVQGVDRDLKAMGSAYHAVEDAIARVLTKMGLIGAASAEQATEVETSAGQAATAEAGIGEAAVTSATETTTAATTIETDNAAIATSAEEAAAAEGGVGAAAGLGAAGAVVGGAAAAAAVTVGLPVAAALAGGFAAYGLATDHPILLGQTEKGTLYLDNHAGFQLTQHVSTSASANRGGRRPQTITVDSATAYKLLRGASSLTKAGQQMLAKMEGDIAKASAAGIPGLGQSAVVSAAASLASVPYVWGGGHGAMPGPSHGTSGDRAEPNAIKMIGLDCSGYARAVLAKVGITLPGGNADALYRAARSHPARSDLQAGDLVFYEGAAHNHVMVYIGGGVVQGETHTGAGVQKEPVGYMAITGTGRYSAKNTSGHSNDPISDAGAITTPVTTAQADGSFAKRLAAAQALGVRTAKHRGGLTAASVITAQGATGRELTALTNRLRADRLTLDAQDIADENRLKRLSALLVPGLSATRVASVRAQMATVLADLRGHVSAQIKIYKEHEAEVKKAERAQAALASQAKTTQMSLTHYLTGITPQALAAIPSAAQAVVRRGEAMLDLLYSRLGKVKSKQALASVRQQIKDIETTISKAMRDGAAEVQKQSDRVWQQATTEIQRGFDKSWDATFQNFDDTTTAGLKAITDQTAAAIKSAQATVSGYFGTFTIGQGGQTPTEALLAQSDAADAATQRAQTLSDALGQLDVAKRIGDPVQIKAAQQAVTDAQKAIDRAALEQKAADERTAADAALTALQDELQAQGDARAADYQRQRDQARQLLQYQRDDAQTALQNQEDDWKESLDKRQITWQQFIDGLNKYARDHGFSTGGHLSGAGVTDSSGNTIAPPPTYTGTGGAGGCFIGGTMVSTPTGYVPIEQIKVGDDVCVWDFTREQVVPSPVVETFTHEGDDARDVLRIETGTSVVFATPEHPFWNGTRWIPAGDLRLADPVMVEEPMFGGTLAPTAVTGILPLEAKHAVYNLHVEHPDHNYFVEDLLVHNVKTASFFAAGGWSDRPNSTTVDPRDTIRAFLRPGEYVLTPEMIAAGALGKEGDHYEFNITVEGQVIRERDLALTIRDEIVAIGRSSGGNVFGGQA